MEDFELTLSINSRQLHATVHTHAEGDTTYYDVTTDDFSISIYKDNLYTWTADDSAGLSAAEIQTIGEQLMLG